MQVDSKKGFTFLQICLYFPNCFLPSGAGDGMVTKKMASHFKNVFVTEVSHQMQYRLAENGFT